MASQGSGIICDTSTGSGERPEASAWQLLRWRRLLAGWSYSAGTGDQQASRRDLRLDLLRGLCLLKMVTNHIGLGASVAIQRYIGYATAAEGFFFISGAVVGIVHGKRMKEHGLGPVSRQVLQRSAQLYIANLAFVLLFVALEVSGTVGYSSFDSLWSPDLRWELLLAFNQPYYLHVLPRYVLFLALTPLALWCLRSKQTWLLLAATAGLYLFQLEHRHTFSLSWLERPEESSFPLLSWQLLFFSGLCLGYHRQTLARAWARYAKLLTPATLTLFVAFLILREAALAGALTIPSSWIHLLLGREHLGPLRLLNLAAVFGTCFVAATHLWRPLQKLLGQLLLPFGQHSLYLFLMHIPLAWLSRPLFAEMAAGQVPFWQPLALEVALVASLWLMIRKRFLFGVVPT